MQTQQYTDMLKSAIISRGLSEAEVSRHVKLLSSCFDESELTNMTSENICKEINELADSIATILKKRKSFIEPMYSDCPAPEEKAAEINSSYASAISQAGEMNKEAEKTESKSSQTVKASQITTCAGKTFLYVLSYVFLGILRLFSALTLFALTIIGTMLFLIGIIYGITQLHSFPASGIYEIGFAIILTGICIAAGVMLYNCIKTFIPNLQKKIICKIKYLAEKLSENFRLVKIRRRQI